MRHILPLATAMTTHHSPLFKIAPEPAIVTGATAMTAGVRDLLKPGTQSAAH